jgi:hypothetical protein
VGLADASLRQQRIVPNALYFAYFSYVFAAMAVAQRY